jgi:hypothetical protein
MSNLAKDAVNNLANLASSAVNAAIPPTSKFGESNDIKLNHEAQKAVNILKDVALAKVQKPQESFTKIFKSGFGIAATNPAPDDPTGGSGALAKMQGALGFLGFLCFIAGFWAMNEMCPGPYAGKKIMYLLLLIFGGGPVGFVYLILAYGLKKKIC